jgi:RHS repeat-associated protein
VGLGTWLAVLVVAAGATFLACGGDPGSRDETVKVTKALTSSCTFTVTKNEYDGPDMWGTITFRNNGPSTATNYVVEFDVPSGAHCTAEPESVPTNATLSPLTTSGNPKQTLGNHCVFTFSNVSLASGASKTFNYSTDSGSSTAASQVTVSSTACGGGSGGGGSASGLTCNTFSVGQNSYDGPNWWGTIKFTNNGPSTASSYVVEFDVPSGKHCTGESDAIPAQASLSPLTYPAPPDPPQTASNHCVFTWTNGTTLLPGDSKTFNYSADSQSITSASNLVIRDGACAGPAGGGAAADTRGSGSILATGTDVGALTGDLSVGRLGLPTYFIPLWTPEGRNGVTPRLSLVYSGAGYIGGEANDLAGLGWSVSGGMSMIYRCAINSPRANRPQGIRFDATDRLCLDGKPLVVVNGVTNGVKDAEYRTEPDTFTKVVVVDDEFGVPKQFKVWTPDGRVHFYGGTTETDVRGAATKWTPAGVVDRGDGGNQYVKTVNQYRYGWLRGTTQDLFATPNKIVYKFSHPTDRASEGGHQEPLLTSIEYVDVANKATRVIKFNYTTRPNNDIRESFVAGMRFQATRALSSIDMQVARPGEQTPSSVRFYKLTQDPSPLTGRPLLTQLQECDKDPSVTTGRPYACSRPTGFSYFTEPATLVEVPAIAIKNQRTGDESFWGIQIADMDQDGRDDVVYRAPREGALPGEPPHWFVRLSVKSSGGQDTLSDPVDLNLADGQNTVIGDAIIADFVGDDGLPDIAVPTVGATSSDKAFAFYQNGGITTASASFLPRGKETTGANQAMTVGDFYGKGYASVLRPTSGGQWSYSFYRVTENGLVLEDPSDALAVTWPTNFAQTGWSITSADVDGDGALDFLAPGVGTTVNRLSMVKQKEIPTGNPSASNWEIGGVTGLLTSTAADPVSHFFLDQNGDGLPDAIRIRKQTSTQTPDLIRNLGSGYAPPAVATDLLNSTAAKVQLGGGTTVADIVDPGIRIVDFDADGRDDILLVDNGVTRDGSGGSASTRSTFQVWLSRGNGFTAKPLTIALGDPADGPVKSANSAVRNYRQTQVLDANGDGRPDIISVRNNAIRLAVQTTTAPFRPEALTEVKDGMGKRTSISYVPLADRTVFTPGVKNSTICAKSQGRVCYTGNGWVVSSYKVENGLGGSQNEYKYSYSTGVYDLTGGGDLGFQSFSVQDVAASTVITETFDLLARGTVQPLTPPSGGNTFSLVYSQVGLPKTRLITTTGTGFARIRKTDFTYGFIPTSSGWSYYTRPTHIEVHEKEILPSGDVEVFNQTTDAPLSAGTDEFGLPPDTTVTTSDAKGDYSVQTTYLPKVKIALWPPIRLTSTIVKATSPVEPAPARTTDYEINDQTGAVERITVQAPTPAIPMTDTYMQIDFNRNDQNGNAQPYGLVRTTTRTVKTGNPRVDTIEYDSQGVHVVSATNMLGHETEMDVDPALGVALSATDANGVRVTMDYDGFGRLRRVNAPGGGGETTTYSRELEPGQTAASERYVMRIKQVADGGGESSMLINRVGQQIRSESKNLDGTTSFVRRTYNALGLLDGATRPALLTSGTPTPGPETVWFYDELGRRTGRNRPEDGKDAGDAAVVTAISETKYEGPLTTFTDDWGRITEYTRDKLGQITKTEAVKGTGYRIPTEYTYGSFGQLRIVERKNKAGTETQRTTYNYDSIGRPIETHDPDAGNRETFFNGFGEVRRIIDGNPLDTTFVRDDLGRPTERHDSDGTTTLTWDTHGKGLLASSKSPSSLGEVEKEYFYDSNGRMFRVITRIGGESFQTDYTFDAFGRIRTVAYPVGGSGGRFTVRKSYDPDSGELFKVQNDADTTQTYWELKATGLDGQIKQEAFGGSTIVTDYGYSDTTGRMSSIKSTKSGATSPFREWGYDYWKDGNLRRRSDVKANQHERFSYDGLGRLELWQVAQDGQGLPKTGGWKVNYQLDDFGNIEHRDFIAGTATGGTDQLAGFTRVHNTNRLKDSPWGPYLYDDNGRQTARPGEGIGYTAFDLPKTIVGTATTTFQYDAIGSRAAKKKSATDYTYYIDKIYEKRVNGNTKEHVFYVMGATGVVAQVRRTEGTTGDTKNYLLADRLGSIDTVMKDDGTPLAGEGGKRDPYGNAVASFNEPVLPDFVGTGNKKVRLGFTGHEHDEELGLINMKGRVFDPRLGMFLSPDPMVEDVLDPQTFNRFAYTRSNPMNLVDPNGLRSRGWTNRSLGYSKYPSIRGPWNAGQGFVGVSSGGSYTSPPPTGTVNPPDAQNPNGSINQTSVDSVVVTETAPPSLPPGVPDPGPPYWGYGSVAMSDSSSTGGGGSSGSKKKPPPPEKPATPCGNPCSVPQSPGVPGPGLNDDPSQTFGDRRSDQALTLESMKDVFTLPDHINGDVDLAANVQEAKTMAATGVFSGMVNFYFAVKPGGKWDYKQGDKNLEDFGNWHFGVVAAAYGFPRDFALEQAGKAQIRAKHSHPEWQRGGPPYGDDPVDQYWIERGYEFYEKNCAHIQQDTARVMLGSGAMRQ